MGDPKLVVGRLYSCYPSCYNPVIRNNNYYLGIEWISVSHYGRNTKYCQSFYDDILEESSNTLCALSYTSMLTKGTIVRGRRIDILDVI